MALKYKKMSGFATTYGQQFEVNLAALLFLRGLNSGLHFQLATNVHGAGALDDVVFRFKPSATDENWTTLYVQLKHKAKRPISRKLLTNQTGDFSLVNYFKSYLEIKQAMATADEGTLFDGCFDKCMFVIFTNAKTSHKLGEECSGTLSVEEEFLWSNSGSVFTFQGDEDILECLGECGEEGVQFLSKLRVFCDQPNENALRMSIEKELRKMDDNIFQLQGVDFQSLRDSFMRNMKMWWEKSNDVLDNDNDLLLSTIFEITSQQIRKENTLGIEFEIDALHAIRDPLGWTKFQVFHYLSSESSNRLSLAKILQALDDKAFFLNSKSLVSNKNALISQWRKGFVKNLIICTTDRSPDCFNDAFEIVSELLAIKKSSIVFVSNINSCLNQFPWPAKSFKDEFLFSELKLESREKVLAKEVSLQGHVFTLRELLVDTCANIDQVLDANSVVEILDSVDILTVGSALDLGIGYYVDRSLEEAVVVKSSVLQVDTLRETVTIRVSVSDDLGHARKKVEESSRIFNIDRRLFETVLSLLSSSVDSLRHGQHDSLLKALWELYPDKNDGEVFIGPTVQLGSFDFSLCVLRLGQGNSVTALRVGTSKNVYKQSYFVFVSDETNENDFYKLCNLHQSKHVLSLKDGELRWVQSSGDIEFIRPHIDEDQATRFSPKKATDVEDRLTLICAEPGMGKSTLMARLAKNTKAALPQYFVILIALNDHSQLFVEGKHNDVLDFLSRANNIESHFHQSLFKYALEVFGNVVILIDGYDEIAPKFGDNCCDFVSNLLVKTKAAKIWMTSRNSFKNKLEAFFSKFSAKLCMFDIVDQRMFLRMFWEGKSDACKIQELNSFIDQLLDKASQAVDDKERNLMGIPLQTQMLAEVYEYHVVSSAEKPKLPDRLDLLFLLEQFVEKKCSIYVQDKFKIEESKVANYEELYDILKSVFVSRHMKAALGLILDADNIKRLRMESIIKESSAFFKKIQCGRDKTGFIDAIVNGVPRFIHRVFAEYFVAKWIAENFADKIELIRTRMFNSDFAVIRNIFDRLLVKDCALHTAVVNENLEKVWNLLERDDADVEAKDGGDRTALHLAAGLGTSENREENERRSKIVDLLIEKTNDFNKIDSVLGGSPFQYADVTQSWIAIDKFLRLTDNKEQFTMTLANLESDGMLNAIFEFDLYTLLGFCLDNGLSVEHYSKGKSRLLLRGCEKGSLKSVALLIERNANIYDMNTARDKIEGEDIAEREDDKTPLHIASRHGNLSVVKLLLSEDMRMRTVPPKHDGPDISEYININDKNANTAMHHAARKGHTEVVSYLISQGGDIRRCTRTKATPFHLAAQWKHPSAVRVLLQALNEADRADVLNTRDSDGDNALMCAAWSGCVESVQLLIQAGGKLSLLGDDGGKPVIGQEGEYNLQVVSHPQENLNAEIEDKMCQSDRNGTLNSQGNEQPSLASNKRKTALHRAAINQRFGALKALLDALDEDDRAVAVNRCDKDGDNVLYNAAWGNCLRCVELVVQAGARMAQGIDTPLMAAAIKGNLEVARYIVHHFNEEREGMSKQDFINLAKKSGRTAIHLASSHGYSDIVSFLINQGGDILRRSRNNSTPLHLAANEGHPSALKVLLESLSETDRKDVVNSRDIDGDSVLMCAADEGSKECVELIVQAGGSFTLTNNRHQTPLMYACIKNHLPLVKYLLDVFNEEREGISRLEFVNLASITGKTAIHFASKHNDSDIVSFLISQGADIQCRSLHNSTPLHLAAEYNRTSVLKVLLEALSEPDRTAIVNSCDKDGDSVLMCASLGGSKECVELIVQAGGRFTIRNNLLKTPLIGASKKDHPSVVRYLIRAFNEEREGMSRQDFINLTPRNGKTAIQVAAENGNADIVSFLICQGGDFRCRTLSNSTPLHFAAGEGHPAALRVLLESLNEADRTALVNSCDNDGHSVLMRAAAGGCMDCVELIVKAGGRFTLTNILQQTPLIRASEKNHASVVKYLIHAFNEEREGMSKSNFINLATKCGRTAIHFASKHNDSDIVSFLISQGADIQCRSLHNSTPLHLAAEYNRTSVLKVLLEALSEPDRTAIVNSCDKDGDSVLMCASLGGSKECVELIVQAGGRFTVRNNLQQTPLIGASENNHPSVVSYILDAFGEKQDSIDKLSYINSIDADGKTAIDLAGAECRQMIKHCRAQLVQQGLSVGIDREPDLAVE